jgi:hypothetical protein
MQVGQFVFLKDKGRTSKKCFIEEIITADSFLHKDQCEVSLYAIDGEYIGDYWEDELELTPDLISEDEICALIKENVDKKGLMLDFVKVYGRMQENKK